MKLNPISRRNFLKIAAVTGAVAGMSFASSAAFAEGSEPATGGGVTRIRTCCRGCGKMECGVWVTVENGRAVKIEGDESSLQSRGHCCTKSQSSMQACYHPDRLHYPMMRTQPKGEDPGWQRITWEKAYEIIGPKFNEMIDKYGGECLFTMNGTSRIWSMGGYASLMWLLQTPNGHLASEICKGPRQLVGTMMDTFGSPWMATIDQPRVYVQWGTAPEYSNYDDSCRVIVDVAHEAQNHIVIDPRMGALGKEADVWLSLRPGTDCAIALSWTKYVIDNDLMDDLYVKRWTNAPFLVVDDMEPSGGFIMDAKSGFDMKTKLLKESDVVEGGSHKRFMVWDNVSNGLVFFDAESGQWQDEVHVAPTTGEWIPAAREGVAPGWLPDPSQFNPAKDPALFGEFEVVLKDGTTHKARPVLDVYRETLEPWTFEHAEEVTGCAAAQIQKACELWTTRVDPRFGNGGLHIQLATDQTGNCTQNVRTIMTLSHLTGNFDNPAGNRGCTRAPIDTSPGASTMLGASLGGFPADTPTYIQTAKGVGMDKFPVLNWYGSWTDVHAVWTAALEGDPYRLRGGINCSGSFMNQCNSTMAWEGMQSLDFWVDINLWHHPGTEMADVLLPCQHWLELDAPRLSQGASGFFGATCKCVEPVAETMHDAEIARDLYKSMGRIWNIDESDPWPDLEKMNDASVAARGISWAQYKQEFQENGWWDAKKEYPAEWGSYHRWETGAGLRQNPFIVMMPQVDDHPGFMTATTKAEIWSTVMETFSPDHDADALPYFHEPIHSPVADPEIYEEYPFNMTTGRRIPVYFHSEHRQLPWCRELWPVPRLEMNPNDAERLGLEQGDWVWIESKWGKAREVVDIYYGIKQGVVNAEHAWWYPECEAPTHGFQLSNINNLVDPDAQDPFIGSSTLRGIPVKVYKATAENSPFGNPVPCDPVTGEEIIHSADDPRLKKWLPLSAEELKEI